MNKTACILCLLFLCLSVRPCVAQTNKVDSLRALLSSAPDRPTRLRLVFRIGKNLHHADSLDLYGKRLLDEGRKHREPLAAGYGERLLGDADFYRLRYESAFGHYFRADSAFKAAGEGPERLTVLSNGAYALMLLGRYGDAIEWASTQMELSESLGDTDNAGQAARSIGDCLLKQKKFREALPYFYKSLAWEKQNNPQDLCCIQLAIAYEHLQMPDSARYFYEKSLQHAQQLDIPYRIASAHQYYGMFFLNQNALDEAEKHLLAAEDLLKNKQDKLSGPGLYKGLSDLELRRNRPEAAIKWAQKALDMMQHNHQAKYWGPVHANLYQAYAALGQPEKALQHALVWKAAADSLAAADNARKVAEVEARFKTREQEAVIARQELELARQRGYLLFGLLAIALTGALAYFFWMRTRAKKREAEYRAALHEAETRRLKELDRVKSTFFANISHEFRTPLSLLISPLRELETGARTGNAKMYAIMRRNAERLLQLVNQLLDLSRLENGRLQLEPRPGNLSAALRSIAGSFESLADRKLIHFDVFVPKAPVWAAFDRDKLEKIASNLLSNAFKFTPEEGSVTLQLKPEPGPDETSLLAVIRVDDTGIGISSDQLPQIFERFYQADQQMPDAPGGSGIGLALTKELVQLHGGRIEVESEERQGSRFIVYLPLQLAAAESDQPTAGEPEPLAAENTVVATPAAPSPEASVLVVEDNADLQDYIAGLLEPRYRVFRAAD
ncbi:MAG: tetratricopeptide repeat-containing sensor histidine kinase, partial [Saprospiraceae bacterium]|nr:tetratricopeptide repeat-containing sensor histidine kinase [Saprospiraceae bacterium]